MLLVLVKVLLSASCFVRVGTGCEELFRKNQGLAYREGCYLKVRRR